MSAVSNNLNLPAPALSYDKENEAQMRRELIRWSNSFPGAITNLSFVAPAEFTVAGSPLIGPGTITLTWATEAKNIVFAGPASGADAVPTFRALVAADIPTNIRTAGIEHVIDGQGSAITSGVKPYRRIPFACSIQEVSLLGDVSGSITVDIWKCTYAQFDAGSTHPVVGDSITASAVPAIATAKKYDDATLTGWTTAIAAGDILAFNVSGVTSITKCTITLKVLKT